MQSILENIGKNTNDLMNILTDFYHTYFSNINLKYIKDKHVSHTVFKIVKYVLWMVYNICFRNININNFLFRIFWYINKELVKLII